MTDRNPDDEGMPDSQCIDCGTEHDIPDQVDRCPDCFVDEFGLIEGMAALTTEPATEGDK